MMNIRLLRFLGDTHISSLTPGRSRRNEHAAGMARLKSEGDLSPGILALAICAGVLWTDVALKQWAENTLTEPAFITSWLCLALQHNAGLFLGTFLVAPVAPAYWFFLGAAVLGLGWRTVGARSLATGAGYALVTGGVAGNALDRVNGAVVDFLGFGPVVDDKWAFANLADFAMLGGALVLGMVLIGRRARRWRPRDQDPKRPSYSPADSDSSASSGDSPNRWALSLSWRTRQ